MRNHRRRVARLRCLQDNARRGAASFLGGDRVVLCASWQIHMTSEVSFRRRADIVRRGEGEKCHNRTHAPQQPRPRRRPLKADGAYRPNTDSPIAAMQNQQTHLCWRVDRYRGEFTSIRIPQTQFDWRPYCALSVLDLVLAMRNRQV
jgi:hypothetical protein